MALVYKPLSNTIQWGKLSKDKKRTIGYPTDVTNEALATVVLYVYDNNQKVNVEMDGGTIVELSVKILRNSPLLENPDAKK